MERVGGAAKHKQDSGGKQKELTHGINLHYVD
jgi:hypothetical protein